MKTKLKRKSENLERSAIDYINELTDRAMDFTTQKIDKITDRVEDILKDDNDKKVGSN